MGSRCGSQTRAPTNLDSTESRPTQFGCGFAALGPSGSICGFNCSFQTKLPQLGMDGVSSRQPGSFVLRIHGAQARNRDFFSCNRRAMHASDLFNCEPDATNHSIRRGEDSLEEFRLLHF
jgi:hypothetical protein